MPEDGLPTAGAAYSPLLRVSGRTARGQACRTERRAGCYLLACDDCCVGSIGLSLRGFFFTLCWVCPIVWSQSPRRDDRLGFIFTRPIGFFLYGL